MDNIIPLPKTASRSYEVIVIEPSSSNIPDQAVQALRDNKVVVVKLGKLDQEHAQRLLDFLSGSAYGISAQLSQVGEAVFLFTPHGINIREEKRGRGLL